MNRKRKNTALRTEQGKVRTRKVVQSMRLALHERTMLHGAARAAGMSVSDYIRAALRAKKVF